MSEYAQTQRRFEKLKQTFDQLIEQNSYKKLREENERLKKQKKDLYEELRGLNNICGAQLRIIESLEKKLEEKAT